MFPDISCVILAGGKNSRFGGKNKAFATINGDTVFDMLLSQIRPLFDDIILVSNNPEVYAAYSGLRVFPDIIKNIGPVGGIYTAMKNTDKKAVFVVACDMPFIRKEIVADVINRYLSGTYDAVVPIAGGLKEPLHSVVSTATLDVIVGQIASRQYSVYKFFDKLQVGYFEFDSRSSEKNVFFNINSLEDLNGLHS